MGYPSRIHLVETQFIDPRRLHGALPHAQQAWNDLHARVRSGLVLSKKDWWEVTSTRESRARRPDHTAEKMRIEDAGELIGSDLVVMINPGPSTDPEHDRIVEMVHSQQIPLVIVERVPRLGRFKVATDQADRLLRIQWRDEEEIEEVLERNRALLREWAAAARGRRARFLQDLALAEYPLQMFMRRMSFEDRGLRINEVAGTEMSNYAMWGLETFPYLASMLTEESQIWLAAKMDMPSVQDAVERSADLGPSAPEVFGLEADQHDVLEAHRGLMRYLNASHDFISDRAVLEMSRSVRRAVHDLGYTAAQIEAPGWMERFREWTPVYWDGQDVCSYRGPEDEPD